VHQRRSRSRFEVEKHGQERGRKKERGRRGIVRHCRANEKKQVQKFNGDIGMKIKLLNGDVGMKIKLLLVASTLLLAVAVYGILAR
jgi:hypothetical protein